MENAIAGFVRRRLLPSLVIRTSGVGAVERLRARLLRALGRRNRVELYFAFDDPYSAIALPGLRRLAEGRRSRLHLYPLVQRGLPEDPALAQRRQHAVIDSQILAQRDGRKLLRDTPLAAGSCSFLAAWCEAARNDPAMPEFTQAALDHLWFGSRGPLHRAYFVALYRRHLHRDPPADEAAMAARLAGNQQRLNRLGHWDSPAARIGKAWFFAHERLAQIDQRLAELGW